MSGLILAGNFYLNRKVNGVLTGYIGPLNATEIALNVGDAEKIQRPSFRRDDFAQLLDSVIIPGIPSLSSTFDDADPEIVEYMMLGTLSDDNVSASSVTDENLTAHLGKWEKLDFRDVSSVVVQDVTDVTTYVLNTDYIIDATAGMIKPLAAGSINDLDVLHVDYTYGAQTARRIISATDTEIRGAVRIDGKNLANQKKIELYIPEVVLVPDGDLALGGKEFLTFSLTGDIVKLDSEPAPYIYREID